MLRWMTFNDSKSFSSDWKLRELMKNRKSYLFDCDHILPIEKLRVTIPRRAVLSFAKEQIQAKKMRQIGIPTYLIDNLTDLETNEFMQIKPVVCKGVKIQIIEQIVCGTPCSGNEPIRLFPIQSLTLNIFNQFNGQQTIAEIVSIIQEETGWNLDKSAAVIRNLFLRLCEVRICEPG